jgi:hypothetical protein
MERIVRGAAIFCGFMPIAGLAVIGAFMATGPSGASGEPFHAVRYGELPRLAGSTRELESCVSAHRPGFIHVVRAPGGAALLLGIGAGIRALRVSGSIVAMNGYGPVSGSPGMPELPQAWLPAGVTVVAGTGRTVDRHLSGDLRTGRAATRALRAAMLEMLHSWTRRARPGYWGAFLAVERE